VEQAAATGLGGQVGMVLNSMRHMVPGAAAVPLPGITEIRATPEGMAAFMGEAPEPVEQGAMLAEYQEQEGMDLSL